VSLFINSGKIMHLDVEGKPACGNGGLRTVKTQDLSKVTCRGCLKSSAARSDEAKFQSNLAAAAPDLLKALKTLLAHPGSLGPVEMARAAIAKAESRS